MLKYFLIRIAPIVFLVALGYSFFLPSSGERQFLRMEAAIKKAQSYRLERTIRAPGSTQTSSYEVQCPDNLHTTFKMVDVPAMPDAPPNVRFDQENFILGANTYERFGANAWKVKTVGVHSGVGICTNDQPFTRDAVFPEFKYIRALAHIEKQGTREVNGEKCRDWLVNFRRPNGTVVSFDYCINSNDDLPRQVKTVDGSAQIDFSLWNRPIPMEAPEVTR